jgi:ABC-type branched-subunit amino acid transport system substrate-binding protein
VKQTRWLAPLLALVLVLGACTRDDPETADTDTGDGTEADAGDGGGADSEGDTDDGDDGGDDGGEDGEDGDEPAGDPTSLDEGGFGDLEAVCQEGDGGAGADDTGLSDDSISIGVFSDKGNEISSGLNKEMYDAAVAFTEWCNEHGGIDGRQIELNDRDAKLFEFEAQITAACADDFALVGGGAVFDEDPNGVRVGCDLPAIPGFVVSPPARVAELQVQPVPNPLYSMNIGPYQRAAELAPESITKFGVMTSSIPATQMVRDQTVEVVESLGYEVIYDREYAPQGETGWRNFVQEMRDAGVEILEFVGQPANLVSLTRAMDTEGWYPELLVQQANFYDRIFSREAGGVAGPTHIRLQYHPFEMAEDNKATQDYLDLMDEYSPRGKVALLGVQGISAWLLFAQAASECGAELSRACLIEEAAAVTDWTGGGLHAVQQPGNLEPSPCFLFMTVDSDGFNYDEDATNPNEGIYNCEEDNVVELEGDYGLPRPTG